MSRKKHIRPDGDEDVKIYPDEPPPAGVDAFRAIRGGAPRYTQTRAVLSGDSSAGDSPVSDSSVSDSIVSDSSVANRREGAEQNPS